MTKFFAKIVDDVVPKYNKTIMEGVAGEHIKHAGAFMEDVIRNAMHGTTPLLKYIGRRTATPEEYLEVMLGSKNTTGKFEISRSDVYMELFYFTYDGVELPPVKQLIPYSDKGIIHISSNKFHVIPVLDDAVISPTNKSVFVRLLRDKLHFERGVHTIVENGLKKPMHVVYGKIYRNKKDTTKRSGITTPMATYLATKHGIKEVFRKYAGIDVEVVIDAELVERKGMTVYGSSKARTNTHDVKIVVPVVVDNIDDQEKYEFVINMVSGVMYCLDVYPKRAVELAKVIDKGDVEKEKEYWVVVLGSLINNDLYGIDHMYSTALDHMRTIDNYMDSYSKGILKNIGIYVDDFFDFLAKLMGLFTSLLLMSKTYNANIMNRHFNALYYIMYKPILGIHTALLDITRKSQKGRTPNALDISRVFRTKASQGRVLGCTSALNMVYVDASTDIRYPKLTAMCELQERGNGVNKGGSTKIPEPAKTLSAYDVYMGTLHYLPKEVPSPKMRLNTYAKLNDTMTGFLLSDEDMKMVKRLEASITGSGKADTSIEEEEEDDFDADLKDYQ